MSVRVLLAEDSLLLREGLVRLFDEAGATVVGAVGDGAELVRPRPGGGRRPARAADQAGPARRAAPRERDVLALMAEGRTNGAISRALLVTEGAVEKHISSIFAKLTLPPSDDDHRRVLAVLAWLRA